MKAFENSVLKGKSVNFNFQHSKNMNAPEKRLIHVWQERELLVRKKKIKEILIQNPNDFLLMYAYALSLQYFSESQAELRQAEKIYRKIIVLAPNWPLPKFQLAVILSNSAQNYSFPLNIRKVDEAIGLFSKLYESEKHPTYLYNLGICFLNNNHLEIAEIIFQHCVNKFPKFSHSYFILCKIYDLSKNNKRIAKRWATKAARIGNKNALLWLTYI